MDNKCNTNTRDILRGLVLFIVLCAIVVLAVIALVLFVIGEFAQLLVTLNSMDAAIVVALITGCVSVLAVIVGAILNGYLTYRHKRQEFLRERREKPYRKLVEINFKMLQGAKRNNGYSADEMLTDYLEFGQELALWGSAKAIRLWNEWRLISQNGTPNTQDLLFTMEKVLIQLRKDMGQRGLLSRGDILKIYINDVDNLINKK